MVVTNNIKAVLVDDERRHLETLEQMLSTFCPDIEILGTAQSVQESLSLIKTKNPNLIFLDIEMPGGNGFSLFEYFEESPFEVVFTTAHDLYAINAIKYAALDYLMKPINIKELKEAVERAKKVILKKKNEISIQKINVLKSNLKLEDKHFTKIALPSTEGIDFIEANRIIRAEADRSYSNFYLDDGKKILVSKPLKDYELLLEQCNFFRIHKSHMVNLIHLEKYVKGKGGYVIMKDGSHVDVSIRKKEDLLNRLM